MKPKVVELKECIHDQIQKYEELPQLITILQTSHAWVFWSMDVIVCMHAITSIGTLTKVKTKNTVWLELDMYFDQVMRVATNVDLEITADTMHQYIVGLAALKTMMHMLSYELDRGAKSMYPDATKARVHFQKDVTTEYVDTIRDYQAWNQFSTVDHCKDVEKLVFLQFSES